MPHSLSIHRCLLSIKNSVLLAAGIVALLSVQGAGQFLAADDLRYSSAGDGASALFQFPPETPAQLVEAAQIAIRLDRPSDARSFLRQLLERDPEAPEMLALRRRYGLYTLLDFRLDSRLQPEAGLLLKHMLDSLPRLSAGELSDRAGQLGTGLSAAATAEFELLAAGEAALPALLSLDPATVAGQAAGKMLETFAADWRRGLLALLPKLDLPNRVRVIGLLGGSDQDDLFEPLLLLQFTATDKSEIDAAASAVKRLAGRRQVPQSKADATALLTSLARQALADSDCRVQPSDSVEAASGTASWRAEAIARATGLLEQAAAIDPDNAQIVQLQQISATAGADPSLAAPAGASSGKPASDQLQTLQLALAIPQSNAAIDVLKAIDAGALSTVPAESLRVLAETLDSPDARIRSLGAELILRTEVTAGPLRSRARRQLAAVLSGVSRPEAVVIMADDQQRLLFRQLLEDRGYAAASGATGPEGFSAAAECLHCELVILSLSTSRWPSSMTLANLRADLRTRMATVVLLGDESTKARAQALAEIHENVVFLEQPVGAMTFDARLSKLRLPEVLLSAADRAVLQQRAADLQAQLQ